MRLLLRILTFFVASVLLLFTLSTWLTEARAALANGTTHRDSLQFYTGGTLVREGKSELLYDFPTQNALQEELLPAEFRLRLGFGFLPFVSPPFVALALGPFTELALPNFYLAAGITNLFLLVGLIVALQKFGLDWPENWRLTLLVIPLMWLPVTWAVREGQVSILLALSLGVGYLALTRNLDVLGGLALSLLWIKPQYAVLVLPALLLWQRWWAASAFAGASGGLFAVSVAVVGFDGMLRYATLLSGLERMGVEFAMFPASYHTLSGALLRLFGVGGPAWLLIAVLVVAVVMLQARSGFSPGSYSLVILGAVLISPHTHLQDLTILLVAITLGWEALRRRPTLALVWVGLWFAVALGLYALVFNRYLLQDGPLVTVPAMLLATTLLVFHDKIGRARMSEPLPGLAVANR